MGLFRTLLAITVVLAHLGGFGWLPQRVAVWCFFCTSGFLIFQVLDRVYMDERGGLPRFFANRALRLLPPFYAVMLATWLAVQFSPQTEFQIDETDSARPIRANMLESFGDLFDDLLLVVPRTLEMSGAIPVAYFDNHALPQAWSLGVELWFYLAAPLLVLFLRASPAAYGAATLLFTTAFVVLALGSDNPDYAVFRNGVMGALMFFWGGAIFHLRKRTGFRIAMPLAIGLFAAYFLMLWIHPIASRDLENGWLTFWLLMCVPITAVAAFARIPDRLKAADQWVGNLSYGLYLVHFLVAHFMLLASLAIGAEYADTFGRYNRPLFGVWGALFSVPAAMLLHRLVEAPLIGLREQVRGMSSDAAARLPADGAGRRPPPALTVPNHGDHRA